MLISNISKYLYITYLKPKYSNHHTTYMIIHYNHDLHIPKINLIHQIHHNVQITFKNHYIVYCLILHYRVNI